VTAARFRFTIAATTWDASGLEKGEALDSGVQKSVYIQFETSALPVVALTDEEN
jgi:hypothetical protein